MFVRFHGYRGEETALFDDFCGGILFSSCSATGCRDELTKVVASDEDFHCVGAEA
jgi:hypothetical protein